MRQSNTCNSIDSKAENFDLLLYIPWPAMWTTLYILQLSVGVSSAAMMNTGTDKSYTMTSLLFHHAQPSLVSASTTHTHTQTNKCTKATERQILQRAFEPERRLRKSHIKDTMSLKNTQGSLSAVEGMKLESVCLFSPGDKCRQRRKPITPRSYQAGERKCQLINVAKND